MVLGGDFILDQPDEVPAVWGKGGKVLWPKGEGLMINGHQGTGKTTLAQQLVLHRLGLRSGDLLDLPVELTGGRVLYLAMDRPAQAARSMRRMVSWADREVLNDRLVVWRGPLPLSPLVNTRGLADVVQAVCPDVDTVVVDSVKDLAPGISSDEVGAGLNLAWQELIARGVELLLLHHERKAQQGFKRAHSLDDVYGSTWLTSGLGSVLALDGAPGDLVMTVHHLKQPVDVVGPLTIRHDHQTGTTTSVQTMGLDELLRVRGEEGVTAEEVATLVYGREPDSDTQTIRRQLNARVKKDELEKVPGVLRADGRDPDRWRFSAQQRWAEGLASA